MDHYYIDYLYLLKCHETVNPATWRAVKKFERQAKQGGFYNLLLTRMSVMIEQYLESKGRHRGIMLVADIHGYKAREGEWPAALEDLSYAEEAEYGRDPFADGLMKYEKQEDSFRLYSVGQNGDDDNGARDDILLWLGER